MRMKKYLLIILLGMVLFSTINIITVSGAAGTVTWAPTEPEPEDVVTIEYDTTGGPLDGMSGVEMNPNEGSTGGFNVNCPLIIDSETVINLSIASTANDNSTFICYMLTDI